MLSDFFYKCNLQETSRNWVNFIFNIFFFFYFYNFAHLIQFTGSKKENQCRFKSAKELLIDNKYAIASLLGILVIFTFFLIKTLICKRTIKIQKKKNTNESKIMKVNI